METLKSIFRFYINGSIHVAVAITSMVQITFVKFDISDQYFFLLLSFFGAITAYNFVKYSNVSKLYHKRLTRSMKGIRFLTIFCALIYAYIIFQIPLKTLLFLLPFVALTVFYVVPILPKKKNLRNLAGIKIFIIAVVWSGTTVLVPMLHVNNTIDLNVLIEAVQRFLFIIIIMLPFEIRDLQYDDATLETVPQKIGVTKTKVFGSILLVMFLLLTPVKENVLFSSIEILSTILVTSITLFFLWGTERKQSEYYCSFWVESIPIFWLLIIVVLQGLFT
ncbi:UbiA prenyltransferase family protein [Aquimarina algicola]|uniref:Prenyltransferase n=1 Tax=Aquimarina algicola TaxID=2589995 RepID=A0A504ISA6_9FLAO|nr:hypothetical protein [Aquimarina algicola]TPN81357.1 hypothetical protein FHK87_25560 [Aquimarina algicola]